MGVVELAEEGFATERAMLRSMLGVEGCAALGEVREAAARRLDQFVTRTEASAAMRACCDLPTRTAAQGAAIAAAGTHSSQLQLASREGDRVPQERRGGQGGEEERWGRADEARGRREDRGRADDRARGDHRGRPTMRSRSRSRSRERASAPPPARGSCNPRSLRCGGAPASAAASVIKPGDWARLRSKARVPRAATHHERPTVCLAACRERPSRPPPPAPAQGSEPAATSRLRPTMRTVRTWPRSASSSHAHRSALRVAPTCSLPRWLASGAARLRGPRLRWPWPREHPGPGGRVLPWPRPWAGRSGNGSTAERLGSHPAARRRHRSRPGPRQGCWGGGRGATARFGATHGGTAGGHQEERESLRSTRAAPGT